MSLHLTRASSFSPLCRKRLESFHPWKKDPLFFHIRTKHFLIFCWRKTTLKTLPKETRDGTCLISALWAPATRCKLNILANRDIYDQKRLPHHVHTGFFYLNRRSKRRCRGMFNEIYFDLQVLSCLGVCQCSRGRFCYLSRARWTCFELEYARTSFSFSSLYKTENVI